MCVGVVIWFDFDGCVYVVYGWFYCVLVVCCWFVDVCDFGYFFDCGWCIVWMVWGVWDWWCWLCGEIVWVGGGDCMDLCVVFMDEMWMVGWGGCGGKFVCGW